MKQSVEMGWSSNGLKMQIDSDFTQMNPLRRMLGALV